MPPRNRPSDAEVREVMRRSPLFATLSQEDLDALRRRCVVHLAERGEVLFRQAAPAESMYLILGGQVRVYLLSAKGDEQILHLYGPGEMFAEAAVLAGGDYPAWAEALTAAALLRISRGDLEQAIRDRTEVAMGMLAGMSSKLHEFAGLIEQLSLKEVPARLAGVLLAEAERTGSPRFRLPWTKRQLAAQIGTVAETLSRALATLRRDGLIEVDGREIRLLDRDRLAELAETG